MDLVALVGLVDHRGWLLMQERDEHAPIDPNKWGLVGGGVEPDESHRDAAHRELAEETGIHHELALLDSYVLPCRVHGEDHYAVYTARTTLRDADVECTEGRQIVFVAPDQIERLDLTDATRAIFPAVIAAHPVEA